MNFAVGSLVHARGREWVVLPQSDPQCLMLRPLGGSEDETVGILPTLETIRPATFELPDPTDLFASRCRATWFSSHQRSFPVLWTYRCGAPALSARAPAHGHETEPRASAHCR